MTWQEELNKKRLAPGGWYGCIAPDGWKDIVLETDRMLEYLDPNYKILQIKEKFGTLRYYFGTEKMGVVNDIMYAVARAGENQTRWVCEVCGGIGELREDRYWLRTLCDECVEARNAAEEASKGENK